MKRRDFLAGGLTAGTVAITSQATGQTQLLSIQDYWRIRFCPPGKIRVRRDFKGLQAQNSNHPIIDAYRRGVAAMKALPDDHCQSWAYQANIHGTNLPFNQWPADAPFSTCNHSTSFLPWHRMYLYHFESIIRKLSGYDEFALPYWNYSKFGQRKLPQSFRVPGNSSNTLYDGTRNSSINNGADLNSNSVSTTSALAATSFSAFASAVNGTPHGAVHGAVGGNMGGFNTAGRDPVFWLHHCNIDRLWEKWLSQGGGRSNPITDTPWMTHTSEFMDDCCNLVTMVNSDVLDTVAQLDHQYDNPRECIPALVAQLPVLKFQMGPGRPIGGLQLASGIAIDLSSQSPVLIEPKQQRGKNTLRELRQKGALGDGAVKVMLHFDGLRLDQPMNGYFEVYLSTKSLKGDVVYVGNVSTFGADTASQASMMLNPKVNKEDHEMGISNSIDITQAVQEIFRGEDIDKDEISIELRAVTGLEIEGKPVGEINSKANPKFEQIRIEILETDKE